MSRVGIRLYLNWMTVLTLFQTYPRRLIKLVFHFLQWIPSVKKEHLPSKDFGEWIVDLSFYMSDLLIIPDFLELIFVWIQPNIRLLNKEEIACTIKYFGEKVNTKNIRISYRIPRRIENLAIAFVTFNTIHFSNKISIPIFIHEMVHIWQYQKFGSVYIFRALKAQVSKEGYNYGGTENLYSKMLDNYIFTDFNFEQQGEIFEDFCRMKESEHVDNPIVEASFEYFVGQVRGSGLI